MAFNSRHESIERIKCRKAELIEKLEYHFARHKAEYAEAYVAYRRMAMEGLRLRLAALEKSSDGTTPVHLQFKLDPPDDNRGAYERALGMLRMSVDEEVCITAQQYAAFVQNDWAWKESFLVKNSVYGLNPW